LGYEKMDYSISAHPDLYVPHAYYRINKKILGKASPRELSADDVFQLLKRTPGARLVPGLGLFKVQDALVGMAEISAVVWASTERFIVYFSEMKHHIGMNITTVKKLQADCSAGIRSRKSYPKTGSITTDIHKFILGNIYGSRPRDCTADHISRDRLDFCFWNLRYATYYQQLANQEGV